jgi:hypothetical protein
MTQAAILAASGSPGTTTGFKNKIINGAQVINQRGASGTTSVLQANAFMTDRWCYYVDNTGYFNWAQNLNSVTPPAGFTNYLGFSSTGNNTISTYAGQFIKQAIEGYNIADLDWGSANAKTCTLSFWVRSSLTGQFGGAIAGGASSQYPFTYTINAANTWEQKTVTITGPTTGGTTQFPVTNGTGLIVILSLGAGGAYVAPTANVWTTGTNYVTVTGSTQVNATSGATFYFTGVQLEVGTTATNFDFRSYGTELNLCQRYFYRQAWDATNAGSIGTGAGMVSGNVRGAIQFPVSMRASPTWNVTTIANIQAQGNGSSYSATGYSSYGASTLNQYFGLSFSGTSASGAYALYFAGAGDPVSTFSAEL